LIAFSVKTSPLIIPIWRLGLACMMSLGIALASFTAYADTWPLTAKQLESLDRIGDPQVSPDGQWAIFDLRTVDFAGNTASHATWMVSLATPSARPRRLEATVGASQSRWAADAKTVYFLSGRSGSSQVWRTDVMGRTAIQVTRLPLDVGTFCLSRDGSRLVVSMAVFLDAEDPTVTRDRLDTKVATKASGVVYDQLLARHWDAWADGTRNHLFALNRGADGLFTGAPVALMAKFGGDVPSKPFGDESDYALTPDGTKVVFTSKAVGRSEAWSTNSDLWMAPTDGASPPRDLTSGNLAADAAPVISPDGSRVAWKAQVRPGYESDRQAVWVMDLDGENAHEVDPGVDLDADTLSWTSDGTALLITASEAQQNSLFRLDPHTGSVTRLTGDGSVSAISTGGSSIVYALSTWITPDQLWLKAGDARARQLTHVGEEALAGAAMSKPEPFSFAGWNGERVHGFVLPPVGAVSGKTYPTVLWIHGGPESTFANSWSYRWNPQVWAGWGYGVVMIDYHGSIGYGQAFTDSLKGHWGDRPLEDLEKGWAAALRQFPVLDGERACAAGASFGGYMVYWMESHWRSPWKCLIAHDGVFDTANLATTTDELWFTDWEFGGTPEANEKGYQRFNPARFTAGWTTPTLVVHSGRDFRVPIEQGLSAFTVLQRDGAPSRFLTFPNENHWVLKPHDSVQWHDTVHDWLTQWL
jgi:dipeptidyl aminopeptidase/acylaminoacyl peptidase